MSKQSYIEDYQDSLRELKEEIDTFMILDADSARISIPNSDWEDLFIFGKNINNKTITEIDDMQEEVNQYLSFAKDELEDIKTKASQEANIHYDLEIKNHLSHYQLSIL